MEELLVPLESQAWAPLYFIPLKFLHPVNSASSPINGLVGVASILIVRQALKAKFLRMDESVF